MRDYEYKALSAEAAGHYIDLCTKKLPDELLAEVEIARRRVEAFAFTTDPTVPIEIQQEASTSCLAALTRARKEYTAALASAIGATLEGKASLPELTLLSQTFPEHKSFKDAIAAEKNFRAEMASLQDGTHPQIIAVNDKLVEMAAYDCRKIGIIEPGSKPPVAIPSGELLLEAYAAGKDFERHNMRCNFWPQLLAASVARAERNEALSTTEKNQK